MDGKSIGQTIHQLRKKNNMTQAQLAEALYVTDKAVSKWETGTSIPDLQQLESITNLFGISYDELLKGNISRVIKENKQEKKKLSNKRTIRRDIDPTEWYALDNAAKVYPSQASRKWNMVFRISCVLKDDIDVEIMQKALDDMVERFPSFMVTLKNGFFWNYFDRVNKSPKIVSGSKYPCQPMTIDRTNYLFRCTVDGKRVGVDFFHSLTDGNGGLTFVMTLVTRYCELLKDIEINDYKGALNVKDIPSEEELEDSFTKYASKGSYAKRVAVKAYHVKGKRLQRNRVTHIILDASKLYNLSKEHNATITEFLTAVLGKVLLKRRESDLAKEPIMIQVPVNLRKKFPSETLRNFAFFATVKFDDINKSFSDLIDIAKEGIKKESSVEFLQSALNANVRDEKTFRAAPLALKQFSLLLVNMILGDRALTLSFSNLGKINAPDEIEKYVDRFEFVLKDPKEAGYNFSAITYKDKCVITFNTSIRNSTLERDFVRELSSMGLELYIEANGGLKNE